METRLNLVLRSSERLASEASKERLLQLASWFFQRHVGGRELPVSWMYVVARPRPYAQTDAAIAYGFLDPPGIDSVFHQVPYERNIFPSQAARGSVQVDGLAAEIITQPFRSQLAEACGHRLGGVQGGV